MARTQDAREAIAAFTARERFAAVAQLFEIDRTTNFLDVHTDLDSRISSFFRAQR
jgi:hypothetical protein